jgi:hypothetical protein
MGEVASHFDGMAMAAYGKDQAMLWGYGIASFLISKMP